MKSEFGCIDGANSRRISRCLPCISIYSDHSIIVSFDTINRIASIRASLSARTQRLRKYRASRKRVSFRKASEARSARKCYIGRSGRSARDREDQIGDSACSTCRKTRVSRVHRRDARVVIYTRVAVRCRSARCVLRERDSPIFAARLLPRGGLANIRDRDKSIIVDTLSRCEYLIGSQIIVRFSLIRVDYR